MKKFKITYTHIESTTYTVYVEGEDESDAKSKFKEDPFNYITEDSELNVQGLDGNIEEIEELYESMTKEQLAADLNGGQYTIEVDQEQAKIAKHNGLVIMFGRGDDLVTIEGAWGNYEVEGNYVTRDGKWLSIDIEDCFDVLEDRHGFEDVKEKFGFVNRIESEYTKDGWVFKTEIPHATFNIYDEGYLYCVGIVFSLTDLK